MEKRVKEQEGVLSDKRYTEYSRAILALTAIGDDPKDVAGYDLTKALEDYDTVVSQGLNGAVVALLALNADRLDVDGPLEKQYLDFILEKERNFFILVLRKVFLCILQKYTFTNFPPFCLRGVCKFYAEKYPACPLGQAVAKEQQPPRGWRWKRRNNSG